MRRWQGLERKQVCKMCALNGKWDRDATQPQPGQEFCGGWGLNTRAGATGLSCLLTWTSGLLVTLAFLAHLSGFVGIWSSEVCLV
jgi:hypothetical protein